LKRGKTATAPTSHRLGNKTIADVCEALIGASLLSFHGTNNVDNAVRAVTELVCSADHVIHRYSDYYTLYTKPTYQTSATTASQRDLAVQVEKIHSYHFRHPRLLRSAFIHPSYPFLYEHVPNYQRLEFLGDSLLDMACINYLYHQFPDRNPQWLTEHKMAMVSNRFLGALCVELGFHKHLLQMNGLVVKNITEYVTEITEARIQAEEEAISAGKSREECSRDFWDSTKSPPKCLPDMVEAYVGAIFVDSEYNYLEVERFFEEHIKWYFEDISIYDTFANKQPVTLLQNFMAQNMGCTNFAFPLSQIPDVGDGMPHQVVVGFMIHNEIVVDKQGESGRYAKVAVARLALEALVGLSLTQFRATYGCDCKDFRGEGM
jgi:endoribonuclease Dicer